MTGTSPSPHLSSVDRAVGAFIGLAVGDALGMPTQSLSPATITSLYGRITAHVGGATQQPYAPGLPAGTVTDDTEQAILVADLLLKGGGHISPEDFARALLNWEEEVIERGSHDLLGPSTKAALEKVRAGADPTTTGTTGTTNGSAMRVTPVGIAYGTADLKAFAEAVHESCRVTHNTQQGFQGAALIAAAVSHGIDGADTRAAIDAALDTVSRLNAPVHWVEGAEVLARTRWAVERARALCSQGASEADFAAFAQTQIGTSVASAEAVPCALALVEFFSNSPWEGLCCAANLGGDTDTIAAMAGAVFGATHGALAFPPRAVNTVIAVNGLDFEPQVEGLLALRHASGRRVRSTGQVIVDLTMTLDHLPRRGGDIFASAHGMAVGGGFNLIYAARQMGAEVDHYGALGEGGMADLSRAALTAIGASICGPTVSEVDTGYCVAMTEPDGERSFVSTRGAETLLPAQTLIEMPIHAGDVVHLCGYSLVHEATREAVEALARRWVAEGWQGHAWLFFDIGPMASEIPMDTLQVIAAARPIWSVNEDEARILVDRFGTSTRDIQTVEKYALVLADHLKTRVIVRAGAAGAWWSDGKNGSHIPTPVVTPRDTNGAGDAHSGALCAFLAEDVPWERALVLANCAGALSTLHFGPATCPSRDEVEAAALTL